MVPILMLPESNITDTSYFYSSLQALLNTLSVLGHKEGCIYLFWIQIYTVDKSLVGKMKGLSKVKFGDHISQELCLIFILLIPRTFSVVSTTLSSKHYRTTDSER